MTLSDFIEELNIAIQQDGHDIYCNAFTAKIVKRCLTKQKEGKWYRPTGVMPPEHFGRHRCSECDGFAMHDWKHHKEQLTDFCPNCGAHMRGEQ